MKIRSFIVAGAAAGALLAPVAAPAAQSIPIPASGPAGAEVIQIAKKDARKNEETRRKAAPKARRNDGDGQARKGEGKRQSSGKAKRKADARKTGKASDDRKTDTRKAARASDAAQAWRERRRDDDPRSAKRKDDGSDAKRETSKRTAKRDDGRREAKRKDDRRDKDPRKGGRDDGRRLGPAEAWRAAHRSDDRDAWSDWRDEARWREERRLAARDADFGWRREDRQDNPWREAWRARVRERDRLLFAPARVAGWTGWSAPYPVRVISAPGAAWAGTGGSRVAAASRIAPVFGWRPTPVTTLFGVGAPAYAYPYGWDARPAGYAQPWRLTRAPTIAPYRSGVYGAGASPWGYATPYSTWGSDGYGMGYDAWGANSLFGDLSVPLAALLLAALL